MKIKVARDVKRYASCAGIFLLLACAQHSGGGGDAQSCASTQNVSSAFQQVAAQVDLKDQNGKFELLVKLTDMNLDFDSFKQALQSATSETQLKIKRLDSSRVLVEFAKDSPAKAVVEKFIEQRKIAHIESDQKTFAFDMKEASVPSGISDAVENSSAAPMAHATATGSGKDVIVAIIDSGVDYTHKDLAPYMWHNPGEIPNNGIDDDHNGFIDDVYGWDFVNNDNDPQADDTKYHGTHVAGIVKQAAMLAGSGVNLKIMALKYLDSTASGRTSNAIQAIDYAIKNGAIIMNNSWGSTGTSQALTDAIERARQANVLFMAAAGNGDSNGVGINIDQNLFYPAADPHDNVISIAAADDSGVLASWSNYGLKNVDLAAPGVNILSTRNGNNYVRMSGTSMATPYVSGVAAMLWSQRPDLAYDEIRKILFSTATPGKTESGKMVTGGVINWSAAMQAATSYAHDPSDKGTPSLTPSACPIP